MYEKYMTLPVALVVGLWLYSLAVHRDEDIVATAPARVVAYLQTLGVAPQGAVLCRLDKGVLSTGSVQCEAMVESVLTRFACDAETCWAR
jgi:hypothetical protein